MKWLRRLLRRRQVPVWVEPDPVVRVGNLLERSWVDRRGRLLPPDRLGEGELIEMPGWLVLECSQCGVLAEDGIHVERYWLQQLAKRHANEVHDGLVGAEGWAR